MSLFLNFRDKVFGVYNFRASVPSLGAYSELQNVPENWILVHRFRRHGQIFTRVFDNMSLQKSVNALLDGL